MTNMRAKLILIAAVLAGLVSILIISRLPASAEHPPKTVLAAAGDLKAGSRLGPKDLRPLEVSADKAPKGAFDDARALDGRVLARDVAKDAVFADDALIPLGKTAGLAAVIEPGMRAMTVRVNDVVGVAGFALPGNYVDIIVNSEERNERDASRKSVSKIVLEKVLVLAVAQESNRDEAAPKVVNAVTLQVSPEQAEKIDLARSIGTLSLVLRNQMDQQASPTGGATRATLMGEMPPAPRAKSVHRPAARRDCTPVIAGTRVLHDCW